MPLNKFFRFPFAVTGDKTPIGDATDPSGIVTYQQGYGPDYSRDPATDPLAKNIERDKMNELFYDITTAIREYQIMGTPDFITSAQNGGTAFSYSKWARVRYDNGSGFKIYQSKIDSNTDLPTVTASWDEVSSGFNFASYLATQAEAVAGTDNTKYMSPLRVSQAVPSATESTAGRLRIATAAEAQALVNDTNAMTPAKLDAALMGGNARAATPAQFDNDTSIATTAFVQRALGNLQNVIGLNSSATLVAADAGKLVNLFGVAGGVITMPSSASVPVGAAFEFFSSCTQAFVVQRSGSDVIYVSSDVTSFVLNSGDTLRVVNLGAGIWVATFSSAQIQYSPKFAASLTAAGCQKLPSGLIIQWGQFTTSSSGFSNITFPITFPNVLLSISGSLSTGINNNYAVNFSYASKTASSIPAAAVATNANYVAASISWIAVGY